LLVTLIIKPIKNQRIRHRGPWWLLLFAGVLLFALGFVIIILPVQSYYFLTKLFAVVLFVAGAAKVAFAFSRQRDVPIWTWIFVGGAANIFVAVYFFAYAAVGLVFLPVITAFFLLFSGLLVTGSALDLRSRGRDNWTVPLVAGILIITMAGFILTSFTFAGIEVITWLGLGFILSGGVRMFFSFSFPPKLV